MRASCHYSAEAAWVYHKSEANKTLGARLKQNTMLTQKKARNLEK